MNVEQKIEAEVALNTSWGAVAPPEPPTEDEKLWGMLANILALIFIGPIVAWVLKKDSKFVRFHALQMFSIFIMGFALSVVLTIVFSIIPFLATVIWPLYGLLNLAILVAIVVTGLKAKSGLLYKLPFIGSFAFGKVYG